MAYIKGSYPALIGGISQQVKIRRLPDQVERQVNMLSDPVTGPRRRGGYEMVAVLPELKGKRFRTELITYGTNSMLCAACACGMVYLFAIQVAGKAYGEVLYSANHAYLQAAEPSSFRFAKHGNDLIIVNTEKEVVLGEPETEKRNRPQEYGWAYPNQGAFGMEYDIRIRATTGGVDTTLVWKMTTGGTKPRKATPSYIVKTFEKQMTTGTVPDLDSDEEIVGAKLPDGWSAKADGSFLFIQAPAGTDISITSNMTSIYMRTSHNSTAPDSSQLPARLPVEADGYIMQIGYKKAKQYYEWDFEETAWKERAAWGTRRPIENLPIKVNVEELTVVQLVGKVRSAGDEENSRDPHFIGKKLTGVGSYQGRLVLLCDEYVHMSGNRDDELWYRQSMGGLRDDDPIEVASTSTYGVQYRYAVPFAGDLLLLSNSSQAIIPGRQTLTPQNAVISTAADYGMTLNSIPGMTGKSIIYPAAGTAGHSSLWEMVPSEFSERQLYSQNITEHVPALLQGGVKQLAVLAGAGYVLIVDSTDTMKLHQYMWAGSEKVHSCFHEWTCPDTVHSVHAFDDSFWILTKDAVGDFAMLRWRYETKLPGVQSATAVPHLDKIFRCTELAPDKAVKIPAGFLNSDPLESTPNLLLYTHTAEGTPFSVPVKSMELRNDTWYAYTDYQDQFVEGVDYFIGQPYLSILQPSPPVLRDQYDAPILMERAVLHNLALNVQDSGEMLVASRDRARKTQYYTYTPVRLYSWDIDAGRPFAASETLQVPVRLDMQSAQFWFQTDSCYDMQITALEYGYRYNQRTQRAMVRESST